MRKLLLAGALLLFAVSFGGGINTQAQETPSISEFNNCVSFFTRKLSVREKNCRWYEFEVSVEGGGPGEPAVECPAFTEFELTQAVVFFNSAPVSDYCLNEFNDGNILDTNITVLAGGLLANVQFLFSAGVGTSSYVPDQNNPTATANKNEVVTLEEAQECAANISAVANDLGIQDCSSVLPLIP